VTRKGELVINAREPRLGVGRLVSSDGDRRIYAFANGGERSFTEAYCELYIKPAPPSDPRPPDRAAARAAAARPKPLPRGKPPPPKASNEQFEAQIRERPDEPGGYLVYADWLLQQQDPRGELITVQLQRDADPDNAALAAAEAKLLKKHADYFVPEALARALKLPRSSGPRCEVTWRNGFFARVQLARDDTASARRVDLAVVARAVLAHPSARFLRSLAIGPLGSAYSYTPVIAGVAKGHPMLAELAVGDLAGDGRGTRAADVGAVLVAMPALTRLVVEAGEVTLGTTVAHAGLRELSIDAAQLTDVDALVGADLPERVSLAVRTDALALDEQLAARLCRGFPKLQALVLTSTRGTSALIAGLIGSPLLPHLVELDLADGDLDDRAASAMMASREQFRHLRRLDVAGSRALSADWAERLAAATGANTQRSGLAITEAAVIRRSPDRASFEAARQIAVADKWLALGYDRRTERVWGEYEGRDHYYVYAHLRDTAVGCGCGSAKNPCKHALALLLLAARRHGYREAPIPDAVARNASPWRPSYRFESSGE
jgi:uncharacterized protein (TIGR02996 family)